ncbi:MAG: protein kinase [Byssovorax sp.]
MIDQVIHGKYRLVRLLGQGGMGAVYEAQHVETGRRLAIKLIHRELLSESTMARFEREARAAGAIESQHIAEVIDAGKDPQTGAPYLVMEFLEGEDLQHLIDRVGPLPPELALRIASQACVGLTKAHEAGVLHRDIKPGNIFLARREEDEIVVKIVDFGIAKFADTALGASEGTGLTRTGMIVGTPLYMSPEQARGRKEIDPRTDVWSLGVVLYHALTGAPPHAEAQTFGDLIAAIRHDPPRPLRAVAPWVPAEVEAVVTRAMAPEVADRFPTMEAMHEAIKAMLPGGSTLTKGMMVGLGAEHRGLGKTELAPPAAPSPPTPVVSTVEGAGADRTVPASPLLPARAPRRSRRSWAPAVLGAIGGALILGLGGLWLYRALSPAAPGEAIGSSAAPPPSSEVPIAPVSVATSPPVPSATVLDTGRPTEVRRVKVVILPADALVEVEGVRVRSKDGVIEISGTLGSVHKVRVFKGRLETEGDVVVTESGAIPPKIELGAPRPAPSPSASPGGTTTKPVPRETFQ